MSNMYQLESYGHYEEKLKHLVAGDYPKPVDEADGISVCLHCGAKYAGNMNYREYNRYSNENKCINIVPKMKENGYWGEGRILERNKEYYSTYRLSYVPCGNTTYKWDLSEQHNEYKDFKAFIESIMVVTNSYTKYSKFLTKEANDAIMNSLPNRVEELEGQVAKISEALNIIANKINQAGHSLSF